jgi:hypothetical protein
VPFEEHDDAKALGARFSWNKMLWYKPPRLPAALFERWLGPAAAHKGQPPPASHGCAACGCCRMCACSYCRPTSDKGSAWGSGAGLMSPEHGASPATVTFAGGGGGGPASLSPGRQPVAHLAADAKGSAYPLADATAWGGTWGLLPPPLPASAVPAGPSQAASDACLASSSGSHGGGGRGGSGGATDSAAAAAAPLAHDMDAGGSSGSSSGGPVSPEHADPLQPAAAGRAPALEADRLPGGTGTNNAAGTTAGVTDVAPAHSDAAPAVLPRKRPAVALQADAGDSDGDGHGRDRDPAAGMNGGEAGSDADAQPAAAKRARHEYLRSDAADARF